MKSILEIRPAKALLTLSLMYFKYRGLLKLKQLMAKFDKNATFFWWFTLPRQPRNALQVCASNLSSVVADYLPWASAALHPHANISRSYPGNAE